MKINKNKKDGKKIINLYKIFQFINYINIVDKYKINQ